MMAPSLPLKPAAFADDGRTDRSKESFQGTVFEGLNQTDRDPISFFRSDFRKARITNCIFQGNNFSRCDFVASVILKTRFSKCDFLTSSIASSVLSDCEFECNDNFNPDLFRCRLTDCTLLNQPIARATWRDSSFVSCRFVNCSIERSTFQNIEFIDCNLDGLDLSQASIYDIDFVNSSLRGMTIDPDYLGTYTFDNIVPSSLHFSYRSLRLDLSLGRLDDFMALAEYFEQQQRWSEAFNIFALIAQLHGNRDDTSILENQWKRCFHNALGLELPAEICENVGRFYRLAKHYLSLGLVSVSGGLDLVASAELAGRAALDSLVLEELVAGASSLRRTIELLPNMEEALAIDPFGTTPVRFQVQVAMDDEEVAKENFSKILDKLAGAHGIPYRIVRVGYGSVLIEAATMFLIVIMLFRVARSVTYSLVEIRLILRAGSRLAELVDHSPRSEEVLEIVKHLRRTSPKALTGTDLVADDIAAIGKTFRELARQAKAGGIEFLALIREVRIFVEDLRK